MADGKIVIDTDLDSSGIEKGLKSLGSITVKGLKAATTAIAGTATAMGGIAAAAVKVGSDFEAQMSRVKAISGATGEEFEQLRNQAIELGADTAFSASEAAHGMENLAAAGFTTSEIMDAMPGMLDLAAAAGEDLASSADIAASTLRGFGLEASDAAHVADVLAENANRTNSSVAETGEAMKYVAPLARAAGISMEETAAAIGIMANAGIQGSQAGTTLRGAISRLSKPTNVMSQAMDELGVSFYDSEGKMLSLTDQVKMMRSAMEGMTDEQKNNYLVTLYGQEALSGMLALINEGEGSLAELTAAYENCDGAAKTAAATMQDNLKGAVEELSGSAETLGILFYDSISGSLKNTVQTVNQSVDEITEAFTDGGLGKAIEVAGDEFAGLASKAASHAPSMVDAAVDFIESFVKGITKNKKMLVSSAGEVAETLAGGLARLLPDELQAPVDDAIKAISKSLSSGGLKKAGQTVEDTFSNLVDIVGTFSKAALPPLTGALELAGEHLDLIAASAAAAFAAFKGYKVVTETTSVLSKAMKAWQAASAAVDAYYAAQLIAMESGVAANATLTAGQAVVGLFTGKVDLATKAQTAWNAVMAANPIGLVVAAVGALAAGLGIYALTQKDATDSSYELSEAQKEVLDSCNEVTQSMNDAYSAREKSVQSIDREYDGYSSLVSELEEITDANGKVKAGYEERAKVITGELSNALGTEIELTNGVIHAIKEVIVQKKAEALLSSMQGEMAEAYEKTTESLNAYKEANKELSETEKNLETATTEANAAKDRYMNSLGGDATLIAQYSEEWAKAEENLDKATAAHNEAKTAVDSAQSSLNTFSAEVNNYNALVDAMATGETAKIESAMTALVTSYKSYNQEALASSEATRKDMYDQANSYVENMELVQSHTVQVADSVYQDMAKAAADSIAEFDKLPGGVSQGIKEIGPEASGAMAAALAQADIDGKLDDESKAAKESFIRGFAGLDSETQAVWSDAWYGALEGLEGFKDLADPAEEGADAFLKSLEAALEVHSPSRAVQRIFSYVWPGAVEGLSEGEERMTEKGNGVISSFLSTIQNGGLLEGARQLGSNIISYFTGGMSSQKGNADATTLGIAESSNAQLGSADTAGTGSRKTSEFNAGVGSQKGSIDVTSKLISDSLNVILGSADTRGTGSRKTSEYNAGVGSNKGTIDNTSRNISNSMNTNLGSADTKGTGGRKGSEYNSGLGSRSGEINSTSKALSNVANIAMGSADTRSTGQKQGKQYVSGVGSQSGQARSEGRALGDSANSGASSVSGYDAGSGFGSGFVSGIQNWVGSAVSAAASLAASALEAAKDKLGIHSPSREMRKVGKYYGQGFEEGISAEEKTVVRASKDLANTALHALDMSDISARMSEAMAFNTGRIAKSFALESSSRIINDQSVDNTVHLSEADILRLAKVFGKVAGNAVADNVEGMAIKTNERELGRVIREVDRR